MWEVHVLSNAQSFLCAVPVNRGVDFPGRDQTSGCAPLFTTSTSSYQTLSILQMRGRFCQVIYSHHCSKRRCRYLFCASRSQT